MSSRLEALMEERAIRQKLGPAFAHAHLEPITDQAHDLRERDYVPFDTALDIVAGKTRRAYGTPRNG